MISLSAEELSWFVSARIKVNLRSHKNIKKAIVSKFKHLFKLNLNLSDISTYQALTLFYAEQLGLLELDVDLKHLKDAETDKTKLKLKLLQYLKQSASEKQAHYYIQQLEKMMNTSPITPSDVVVILQDKYHQLNILVLNNNAQVIDKIILDFELISDAWHNISVGLVKLLAHHKVQQIIYSIHTGSQKSFNHIIQNIKTTFPDIYFNAIFVPLIGAFAFAKSKETIVQYPELTETQRAAIFLAKHAWNPNIALRSLAPEDIIFDPIQNVFDKLSWNKKIEKVLKAATLQKPFKEKKVLNTAMADALKKLQLG